jgi:hypothetical protein
VTHPPEWTDPFCWSTINEQWTEADDVIEEIREIRRQIWARFDNDVHKYAAHLMEQQKRHGDRLVDPETWQRRREVRDMAAAERQKGGSVHRGRSERVVPSPHGKEF